ncbi:MAG: UDP-3-O-(3-hydroxymyristoyl)glucosamine N-acyltransferase [Bacteroidota bacterium]|nr:UDP-3-O-(3-hydroxymyristoyl)glucosamine N-acyltransferase [Bacteroidota bacterium]MDP4228805.1 UDP-3-O-(3-hydroxymyristoyl)glucosamine N-acyltransferase [Bacteroidota bacterium]MDP4235604.1 UDP-3-O-(3-hydroxymyristoyl)glucosamine N-acyltransferase [Bacteroidota bacterium]
MTIRELAAYLNATSVENASDTEEISHAATISEAGPGSVTFIANPLYEKFILTTDATAVIVATSFALPSETTTTKKLPALIRTDDPYGAFSKTLALFNTRPSIFPQPIHPSAVVSEDAQIASSAKIGPLCFVGSGVTIGEGSVIHPGSIIYDGTVIGNNVVIGAGSVIGFDGFGYAPGAAGQFHKIPQIGNVIIEDNVEIGALCTIDRATVSHTIIRRGAKLDNLIHIAHNVEIGENTMIAAQTGISGSARIGKRNQIAGQVGLIGHIDTADDVIIIAQSGVSKSITKAGTYFGAPAKEFRTALRQEGALRQLPELIERVKELEEQLRKLGTN